jgi:hypothetical protein
MADTENTPNVIDETPISPSRPNPARKNSLEYHLSHRPERQELVDRTFSCDHRSSPAISRPRR